MKIVIVTFIALGYCASLNSAGMYHYHNQPAGPPPSLPQYLPNYDVPPPQDHETVKHQSWENLPWTPITTFPWPGPEYGHEVYYAPHYHGAAKIPCPNKKKVTTTTTHKPTTTTTTTHRPVETKKPHLLEKLGNTHNH
ncbi:uncharacterized protein LOC128300652 [Anopheles moucheti]|uniref:uncharacterized protein LOC128300652 n=1 Tax=Anopheles moucheti TaxID=186751 RepID=UPI0022F06B0D|nr:uncharacterized protein LOC128300652 [Anopheles moucheti]